MIDFIEDDFELAEEFVSNLPPKTKSERFGLDLVSGQPSLWTPTHVVLVKLDGKIVAMADSLHSEVGSAANASMVALRGHGAYALKALLHLKRMFPENHWESTLRAPSPSTIAISRRYFDATYDQGAWEISQELIRRFGPSGPFLPFPIITCRTLLTRFGIKSLSEIDRATCKQIMAIARNPNGGRLEAPNGKVVDPGSLMAFAFDLSGAAMIERQHTTRLMLLGLAAAYGSISDPSKIKQIAKPRFMGKFFERLERSLSA